MSFNEVKGNLGFGCMRLPMVNGKVETDEFSKMVDAFIAAGFNYFDTAHGYLDGESEKALKTCLTSRYPRESYLLADKLSPNFFSSEEDIIPMFESQLEICGVDYFDFYLMHCQSSKNYDQYQSCHAYEIAAKLREQGKIRHLGFSFHDTAEFLDKILTDHPEVEFVQLQFNYLDYDDDGVQARACLETAAKHGKKVVVMEPVKGGLLAALPEQAGRVFSDLKGSSLCTATDAASYAIRFAAGFPEVFMVLSGMGSLQQMNDNTAIMKNFTPLTEKEKKAVFEARDVIRSLTSIQCTGCRYCTERCPKGIEIPSIFTKTNQYKIFGTAVILKSYNFIAPEHRASMCVKCGACEKACPQNLPIRSLLEEAVSIFEK